MSNAAASRHLCALEERLAVRLIERNTRRLWLTEAGQEFLQRCGTILSELAEAEDAVSDRAVVAQGHAAGHELAVLCDDLSGADAAVVPCALSKAERPDPRTANRYPDFIEAGIDVAICTREHEPDPTSSSAASARCGACWPPHLPILRGTGGPSIRPISPATTC